CERDGATRRNVDTVYEDFAERGEHTDREILPAGRAAGNHADRVETRGGLADRACESRLVVGDDAETVRRAAPFLDEGRDHARVRLDDLAWPGAGRGLDHFASRREDADARPAANAYARHARCEQGPEVPRADAGAGRDEQRSLVDVFAGAS